jgi:hypothetical protein
LGSFVKLSSNMLSKMSREYLGCLFIGMDATAGMKKSRKGLKKGVVVDA